MLAGTSFAALAGLMWGLVFVAPTLLADYPATMLSFGRYLAFGLIALPLAWLDRDRLRLLGRPDWIEAARLSVVGNVLYYLFLAAGIQRAGSPLPTMIIGTLPVVIAICSNLRDGERDGRLPWLALVPSLLLIAAGIGCINHAEVERLRTDPTTDLGRYASGALLTLAAVACWTWYPLRNADWLRGHPDRSPRSWTTAQGLVILPVAALGFAGVWLWGSSGRGGQPFAMPFGPTPGLYVALMFAIAFFSTWLGSLCWNEASQRLPTTLVSQLIVFETLAALAYAYLLRGRWPSEVTLLGILLLVAGVIRALRIRPEPREAATAHGA